MQGRFLAHLVGCRRANGLPGSVGGMGLLDTFEHGRWVANRVLAVAC